MGEPSSASLAPTLGAINPLLSFPSSCSLCNKPLPSHAAPKLTEASLLGPLRLLVDDLTGLSLCEEKEPDPDPSLISQGTVDEMEEQLCKVRAENSKIKRTLTRMYTLTQSISTEIRNNSNLLNSRISSISDTVDYTANSIANVDSKVEDNYRNITDLEGKVGRLREDLALCIPGFHDTTGSSSNPEDSMESPEPPDQR